MRFLEGHWLLVGDFSSCLCGHMCMQGVDGAKQKTWLSFHSEISFLWALWVPLYQVSPQTQSWDSNDMKPAKRYGLGSQLSTFRWQEWEQLSVKTTWFEFWWWKTCYKFWQFIANHFNNQWGAANIGSVNVGGSLNDESLKDLKPEAWEKQGTGTATWKHCLLSQESTSHNDLLTTVSTIVQ